MVDYCHLKFLFIWRSWRGQGILVSSLSFSKIAMLQWSIESGTHKHENTWSQRLKPFFFIGFGPHSNAHSSPSIKSVSSLPPLFFLLLSWVHHSLHPFQSFQSLPFACKLSISQWQGDRSSRQVIKNKSVALIHGKNGRKEKETSKQWEIIGWEGKRRVTWPKRETQGETKGWKAQQAENKCWRIFVTWLSYDSQEQNEPNATLSVTKTQVY